MKTLTAKDIIIKPITSQAARSLVAKFHYSGKSVNNSQLHLGVFLENVCYGVMQFGPPMVKKNTIGLVSDTGWNDMLELNRMAFGLQLPKNSESRALAVAFKIIKKQYPHIKWILSFADGTQCGDGTIYRASGFVLTQIKKNTSIIKLPDGTITTKITMGKGKHILKTGGKSTVPVGSVKLPGFQLRYIKILDPNCKLLVPIIPFGKIAEMGASMYKGKKREIKDANV